MIASPSLFLFYVAATLTIGGGLGVVMTRNIVHAAFGLLIAMVGVAGIFLMMFAEFLALVQILIYGGAIVIVILFALMLTRIQDLERLADHRQWPIAGLIAISVFAVLAVAIVGTNVSTTSREAVEFSVLGETLFTSWAVPFEIASLVLLVALIGSIVLVRTTGDRD